MLKYHLMIPIYTQQDKLKLQEVGSIAAQALEYVCENAVVGVTTDELDQKFIEFLKNNKGTAACKNFQGYPKSLCISVNDEVCHGIPGSRVLKEGDVVSIDLVVEKDGYYGDTCKTITIGQVSAILEQLIKATKEAMMYAIKNLKIGMPFAKIGQYIETIIKPLNFGIIRDYCGHGIGKQLHHEPQILHYYNPTQGKELIQEGMCFTIEPMICLYNPATKIDSDGWTVRTVDAGICAQFEHTIFMDKTGSIITTCNSIC